MYWSTDVGGKKVCPECGDRLEQESHLYVFAVRKRGEIHPFVTGNDGGYFCFRCPVVVLDHSKFSDFASIGMGNDIPGSEFAVLGLVDLEAIPEDKKHLSLGDEGNPIPLVQFLKTGEKPMSRLSGKGSDHPVGRNDYCPCGSGKKFKKCCGA
jgi:hypothetical protein